MQEVYIKKIKQGVIEWLEAVRCKDFQWGRWKYNHHMCRSWGLQCSGLAIDLLDMAGELEKIPQDKKDIAAEFLLSCQDEKDGYFKDPLVDDGERGMLFHAWPEIWHQMSAVTSALSRLGKQPLHPLPKSRFIDLEEVNIEDWIYSLDWTNPWRVGSIWAWAIISYAQRKNLSNQEAAKDPIVCQAFEVVENGIISADSGMPTKRGCINPSWAMAGLFKMLDANVAVSRPLACPKKAVDFTLELQNNNGEFGYGRDMCINWDALKVLRVLNDQLSWNYRFDDIARSGNMMAEVLLSDYLKPDGAFAFHGDYCLTMHNSIRTSAPYPEGDMLGTIMCWYCLSYADEWNNGEKDG